jgi:hypothetical protein
MYISYLIVFVRSEIDVDIPIELMIPLHGRRTLQPQPWRELMTLAFAYPTMSPAMSPMRSPARAPAAAPASPPLTPLALTSNVPIGPLSPKSRILSQSPPPAERKAASAATRVRRSFTLMFGKKSGERGYVRLTIKRTPMTA